MIKITEIDYPKFFELLELISHDSGAGCHTQYEFNDSYAEKFANFESEISDLTQDQMETFAIGEEMDALEIVENYGLEELHVFLNKFFEGNT